MKRIVVLGLVTAVAVGALGVPAEAKKKKPKPTPPAPVAVPTTMYMDGTTQAGEQETANAAPARPGTYLTLGKEAGSGEKSHGIPSYSVGPNNRCAGNSLFPVFVGPATGTIRGDVKVTFEAASTPGGKAEVRIWPDLAAQACNDTYPEPAGSVVVDLPTGRGAVEATIPGVDFAAAQGIMIQITGVAGTANPPAPTIPPFYARAYYGTDASKVEFQCIPAGGASSCLP